ncbi:MAG: hypothetical protein R6V31_04785 [Halohasta sp.]
MEQPPSDDSGQSYTVVADMNEHGGMTVVDATTNSTYQLVEYDNENLRRELAAREIGDSVTLQLDRAGVRANVWRASRVEPVVLAA